MTIPILRYRYQPQTSLRARLLPSLQPLESAFRVDSGFLQWRLGESGAWTNLLAIADVEATVSIGAVTTLAAGEPATVANVGTSQDAVLDFGIPQGIQGDAATVAVGTVTTVAYTDPATVTNVGTVNDAIFDFDIPQGDPGDAATIAVGTVTTVNPGDPATVTNVGTAAAAIFDFDIPRGAPGVMDSVVAGTGIDVDATDPANPVVAVEATLQALNAFNTNGFLVQTAAATFAGRSIAVTASTGLSISNGDGVAGNPTLAGIDATTSVKGVAELATAAEYRTGTDTARVLGVDEVWNAAELATLTDGATIAVDLAAGFNFGGASNAVLALGGNRELGAPSTPKTGQSGVLWFGAATSTRTLTLNAAWLLMDGVEVGPYSITTAQILGVAYVVRATAVYVTAILRRAA